MSDSDDTGAGALTIDPGDEQDVARWARELDATAAQIREAVQAVGPLASDVELHLKGSRSATNADQVDAAE